MKQGGKVLLGGVAEAALFFFDDEDKMQLRFPIDMPWSSLDEIMRYAESRRQNVLFKFDEMGEIDYYTRG